jgi:tetratricopeptide (TPR) repeat protein
MAVGLTARVEVPLEDALRELSRRMQWNVAPEQRARLMNMAGDLCIEAGQRGRALLYLDACIDLYITARRFAAASAVCEKLLRLNPDVVRARCTLAWLALARGLDDEAYRNVEEYGDAAVRLELPGIALQQLRAMAEETDSEQVLEAVAHALLKLGDPVTADRVFGMTHSLSSRTRRLYGSPGERDDAIVARLTAAWCG